MKFLVFLVILCASSASTLHLEAICPVNSFLRDGFLYEGVRVNSFHRVRQNVTFEPLSYFLVDHRIICNPFEFRNKDNHLEALKARNR